MGTGLQRLLWSEAEVNGELEKVLGASFDQMIERSRRRGISNRVAAISIGVEKVRAAAKRGSRFGVARAMSDKTILCGDLGDFLEHR